MYVFLMLGHNFIKDKAAGAKAHKKRMNFEMFLYKHKLNLLKRCIYTFFAKLGIGRTCIIYCRKGR